jgi:hypothetical protein
VSLLARVGRLSPRSDRRLDGTDYLWLTALMGAVGWGVTAYLLHVRTAPPKGAVTLREVGPWIEAVSGYSWPLMGLWGLLFAGLLAVSVPRVERGAFLSAPSLVWVVGTALALAANAYSLVAEVPWLTWLPWLVLFAVGYLVTGVLVTRGGVYLAAGLASVALAANGVYGVLTNTGCLVVTLDPVVETPLAGAVLLPMPLTYVVLGLLHVGPLAVDAARGGRGLNAEGVPHLKAAALDDEDGGVVGR